MNQQRFKELADQAGLQPYYDAQEKQIEKFAELVRKETTAEVVKLCAKTIDTNLREEKQKTKNKHDLVEAGIIIVLLIAWCTWWYSMGH